MVYRLKSVDYKGKERRILLQNENGPCPLLAAANILLLKGTCQLPAASVRNGVASLEDVTNMLAEQAIHQHTAANCNSNTDEGHAHYYVDELVQWIPKFQYGMDVNPSFTQGITGYEYTAQLTAFDMLRCKLVHGWLVDIQDEATWKALGNKTYNELIERVIQAKEAEQEIQQLQTQLNTLKAAVVEPVDLLDSAPVENSSSHQMEQVATKLHKLQQDSHDALLIQHFFESTGHQLTHYGLVQLHEQLQEDEMAVFFRNNHFGSLTKHEGLLYLLVTDLGYANSPAIVWERLDVIDGDTEYVNAEFKAVPAQDRMLASGPTLTPEQMMAASNQSDADYHLALHLSMQQQQGGNANQPQQSLDDQEGQIMAAATEASLRSYHGVPDVTSSNDTTSAEAKSDAQSNFQLKPGQKVEIGVPVTFTSTGTVVQLPPKQQQQAGTLEDADRLLAMQLQNESAQEQQVQHHDASLHLAQQLQFEEDQRARARRQHQPAPRPTASSSSSNCVIS